MKKWTSDSKNGKLIEIRIALPKDADQMFKGFQMVVEEGLWLPTLSVNADVSDWVNWISKTLRTRETLLIATVGGKYAGHLSLQPEEWNASQHVAKLGIIILKEYRNIGIGRALMLCAEEVAVDQDYEKIILSTFKDNVAALALYKSLGYRVVGQRTRQFKMPNGYIDELLLEKLVSKETD